MKRPKAPEPDCPDCGSRLKYLGILDGQHTWECTCCERAFFVDAAPQQMGLFEQEGENA